MQPNSNPPEKEATILGLSEELGSMLSNLRNKLDNRFDRTITEESKSQETPQAPNVLDEIIDNLQADQVKLNSIMSVILEIVLPKIN